MSFAINIVACMKCEHGRDCPRDYCICRADDKGIGTIPHAHAGTCPIGLHVAPDPNAPPYVAPAASTANRAPGQSATSALWRELHLRALHAVDLSQEPAWLAAWLSRVPCGTCKIYAVKCLAEHPWDLSSAESYFAHGVKFHNAVNRDLRYREWTVEEARSFYRGLR